MSLCNVSWAAKLAFASIPHPVDIPSWPGRFCWPSLWDPWSRVRVFVLRGIRRVWLFVSSTCRGVCWRGRGRRCASLWSCLSRWGIYPRKSDEMNEGMNGWMIGSMNEWMDSILTNLLNEWFQLRNIEYSWEDLTDSFALICANADHSRTTHLSIS